MRPLRVVVVSTKHDWHGGEEQARQLALGLRSRGHDCHVCAPRCSELACRLAEDGFSVLEFAGRGRNLAALWSLRRYLAEVRPHVLHYNDSHALTSAGIAAWGMAMGARVAARRVAFPVHSSWPYRWLADRVVCVSRQAAGICRDSAIPDDRLRVVYDGVDPLRVGGGDRRLTRRALGIGEDQRLVLTVARLTGEKGHRFLLDAFPAVLDQHPRARLALAGDGALQSELKQQARDRGLSRHVSFLGYRRDVADLLAACDLFVLPSQQEGLGSSLVEAMLARRPIVTTTAGGIPELVGCGPRWPEPVAEMIPPCDPNALAAAIGRVLADSERAAELVRKAHHRATACFTVDRMVEATLDVYRELLPGHDTSASGRRAAPQAA